MEETLTAEEYALVVQIAIGRMVIEKGTSPRPHFGVALDEYVALRASLRTGTYVQGRRKVRLNEDGTLTVEG